MFFRLLTTLPLLNFPAANYQGKLTYCFSCILGKTTILPTTTIEKWSFSVKIDHFVDEAANAVWRYQHQLISDEMRDDVSTAIRSVVKRLFVVVGGMIGLLNEGFKSKTNCFCLLWVRRTLKGIMFVDENRWKMMRFHSLQDVWPLPANSSNEIDTTKQYIISKNSSYSSITIFGNANGHLNLW